MDEVKAARWVQKNLAGMIESLGVTGWRFEFSFGDLVEHGAYGVCDVNPRYEVAEIVIDAARIDSTALLASTIRHELLHVVTCGVRKLYDGLRPALEDKNQLSVLTISDELHQDAAEYAVLQLERLLDRLGLSAEALVRKGNKMLKARGKDTEARNEA